jgi:hypothetical protein
MPCNNVDATRVSKERVASIFGIEARHPISSTLPMETAGYDACLTTIPHSRTL